MQKDLFGKDCISQAPKGRRKEQRPMPEAGSDLIGKRCKGCKHLFRHTYTDRLIYCRLFAQDNTAYGRLKIKSNWPACINFEPKAKEN